MTVADFQLITLSSVALPIGAAALQWKHLEKAPRYLGLFLLFGLLIDVRHHVPALIEWRAFFLAGYVLCEMLFYVWFIQYAHSTRWDKLWLRAALIFLPLCWLLSYGGILFHSEEAPSNGIFDVAGSVVIITLASHSLLSLTKVSSYLFSIARFWFLTGILVYFMCSILIFSFVSADFRDDIWFLHGVFDAIKNVLFAMGFVVARPDTIQRSVQMR